MPYYTNQYGYVQWYPPRDTFLINDITKAIISEAQDYYFYERLAQLATNEQDRQIIYRIQLNEQKHYRWFRPILRRLGGDHPQIPEIELPKTFEEGLKTAIYEELQESYFYMYIASRANHNYIIQHFTNASIDERRHASWLQYMLTNLQSQ
jgi:rubrerythrin